MSRSKSLPESNHRSIAGLAAVMFSVFLLGAGCGGIDFEFGEPTVGSGVALVETIDLDLDEVEQLKVDSDWNVEVEISDSQPGVEIEIDDNLRHLVSVEVDDDRLVLSLAGGNFVTEVGFNATVTLPALTDLKVSGAATVRVEGEAIELDEVSVSGASSAFVNSVAVDQLDIDIDGASIVELAGTTAELDLRVNGASDAQLSGLTASSAYVNLGGASEADIFVLDRVTGSVSGASAVTADGSYEVDVEMSGASTFDRP